MNYQRRWHTLGLGLIILVAAFTATAASTQLTLHWDKEAGTSRAVVANDSGTILAEVTWDGALPRAYAADSEKVETPTFLLANLRDQIQLSSAPGADAAFAFIRTLLGPHADTPIEELSADLQTWIPYSQADVEELCGSSIDTNGECVQSGGEPQFKTALCSGSACKKTQIRELE